MVIEEAGKVYHIDDETGLVTEASLIEDAEALSDEFRIGDRVVVSGQFGEVVSVIPSYYGAAFGVQFDNGDVDEFGESQMARTAAEKKASYESPILEIFARYAAYQEMEIYTPEEQEAKRAEARWLSLSASSLRAHTGAYGEADPKLDEIVLTTRSDLKDLDELRLLVDTEANQKYLTSLNRYKISDEIHGYGASMGGKDDASWLSLEEDNLEVIVTTDADLAARATEVVAFLSREQLLDDDFMRVAGTYQYEYLQMDPTQKKTFDRLLSKARVEKIKELPVETKTASTTFDLEDTTDIFI